MRTCETYIHLYSQSFVNSKELRPNIPSVAIHSEVAVCSSWVSWMYVPGDPDKMSIVWELMVRIQCNKI